MVGKVLRRGCATADSAGSEKGQTECGRWGAGMVGRMGRINGIGKEARDRHRGARHLDDSVGAGTWTATRCTPSVRHARQLFRCRAWSPAPIDRGAMDIAMMIWVLKASTAGSRSSTQVFAATVTSRSSRSRTTSSRAMPSRRSGSSRKRSPICCCRTCTGTMPAASICYPKARVWIQKEEYDYYTGEGVAIGAHPCGIDADDVQEIVRRNIDGKVSFVRGDRRHVALGDHVRASAASTRSPRSSSSCPTRPHAVVIASDNMYSTKISTRTPPIAQTLDAASNLRTQDRIEIAGERAAAAGAGPRSGGVHPFSPASPTRIVRIE